MGYKELFIYVVSVCSVIAAISVVGAEIEYHAPPGFMIAIGIAFIVLVTGSTMVSIWVTEKRRPGTFLKKSNTR